MSLNLFVQTKGSSEEHLHFFFDLLANVMGVNHNTALIQGRITVLKRLETKLLPPMSVIIPTMVKGLIPLFTTGVIRVSLFNRIQS